MSNQLAREFARLLPVNQRARCLFSRCLVYSEERDPYHMSFIIPSPNSPSAAALEEPVESSTEYDTHHSNGEDGELLRLGYYVLSFDDSRQPKFPRVGWKCGRGASKLPDRGVDILLARPGDIRSKSLASVHFKIRVSPDAGLLMLRCSEAKEPQLETNIGGRWELLEPGHERLIYQRSTTVRAGSCDFEIQYVIRNGGREAFLADRDLYIKNQLDPPTNAYKHVTFIPGDNAPINGQYLQLATRGRGTFGWLSQSIDTRSGRLLAIKEVRIVSASSWREVEAEVEMTRRMQDKVGLLPLIDSCCEHGYPKACSSPEKYYIYLPFAISDLSYGLWEDQEMSHQEKLRMLEQTLQGLNALHEMGIIHRDIRPQNMLRLPTKPPKAAICDYGKAIESESSDNTKIGPIHTLAPEVWNMETYGPYTRSIDVWAFGYTIAEVLGCLGRVGNHPIAPERYKAIVFMLQNHGIRCPDDKDLVDLALRMLTWDPTERLTASQALQHRCWDSARLRVWSDSDPIAKGTIGENRAQGSRADPPSQAQRSHERATRRQKFSSKTEVMIHEVSPNAQGPR